ncbi:hypothetical protein GQ43DRAFT_487773 [Delitschia confertaspora ATCC 74209]|uniref:Uncharacterized protein n=1 Tax=Delitschia confertaspora ATCC 74209 TaxID=1513339 RepID=A0A9P4MS80_9PLEO|nr:hypothetical protein GQ43DRAFT_487773 [Delitschia confertaspora ATCC 74209]
MTNSTSNRSSESEKFPGLKNFVKQLGYQLAKFKVVHGKSARLAGKQITQCLKAFGKEFPLVFCPDQVHFDILSDWYGNEDSTKEAVITFYQEILPFLIVSTGAENLSGTAEYRRLPSKQASERPPSRNSVFQSRFQIRRTPPAAVWNESPSVRQPQLQPHQQTLIVEVASSLDSLNLVDSSTPLERPNLQKRAVTQELRTNSISLSLTCATT